MSSTQEFFALVSNDANVKIELGEASIRALVELAREKGLVDDAKNAIAEVTAKIAEAHGFDLNAAEEFSADELEAIAGGLGTQCSRCSVTSGLDLPSSCQNAFIKADEALMSRR